MRLVERFFQSFFPFLIIGVGIVLAIMGLFLFSYLLIGGAIVALILYVVAWVRARFVTQKQEQPQTSQKAGRIIDAEYEEKRTDKDQK
jgi:membrane protein implicated in regulation of membrane protease activity